VELVVAAADGAGPRPEGPVGVRRAEGAVGVDAAGGGDHRGSGGGGVPAAAR
ncbi:hypothetical protein THAOC_24702, partial [Thalassiosira oceanica]